MPKRRLPPKDFEWTPQLAYAVGLLVTDGNLSGNQRHITMRSVEPLMLETFKKCLGLNSKIGTNINVKRGGYISYRVQFSNVQFYDWLLTIGLFPAKSYTIGPIAVPDQFFKDYFRGCIDGDGSIQTYQDNYNFYRGRNYSTQRLWIRLVSASKEHIIWAQSKIILLADIHGAIIRKPPADETRVPLWELKFAKKESVKLINWMYHAPDVPCLERKRAIAQKALAIISQQKRREYTKI
jgi:hypothetical protein